MALRKLDKTYAPETKEIRYLNKTFPEFKQSLIDYAKVYFPDTYTDFSEASPGSIFLEMAAYVGDVLSYYTDQQFKESLIQYAEEEDNIISIAQSLGYRIKPSTAAMTDIDLFQLCPASSAAQNYVPDSRFFLRLNVGAEFTADEYNVSFRTINVVDFADQTDRDVSVYATDPFNKPLTYLIRKRAKVMAGNIKVYETAFGAPQRFSKITLPDEDVLEIIKVEDSNGYTWHQVDYLAQDIIFEDKVNINFPSSFSASLSPMFSIKPTRNARRFVLRYNENFLAELQFGSGTTDDSDPNVNLDPRRIGNSEYENVLGSTSIDPSDFLSTTSYGLAPSNIEMRITYSTGGGIESNVPSNSITKIKTVRVLNDASAFTPSERAIYDEVVTSLTINNPFPASGGKGKDGIEEIRQNALAFFNAQNRLVTHEDYVVRCYAMPGKYGGVSKVYATKDEQINDILRATNSIAPNGGVWVEDKVSPNVVNLHVLGYNKDKKLVRLNPDVKQNLRTYLDQYRILTDEVRIFDGFVINIGVEFHIVAYKNYNMSDVLARSIDAIRTFFDIDRWQLGQPIILSDLYMELAAVDGVMSITSVSLFNRYRHRDGLDYNEYIYDINAATENGVVYPSSDPSCFEVRYPEHDIIGNCTQ